MSLVGPSRHFAAAQQLCGFRREADIEWQARSAGSVANDLSWTRAAQFILAHNMALSQQYVTV
jgi:hypothetical protein